MKRGFTLIEILIAASVLGLGVLGIATLFAGAAQQQRLATDQTDSLRVAGNIGALLDDRFNRLGGVALSDENSVASNAYIMPGQWHAVPSQAVGSVTGGLESASLLDLIDDGTANQSLYGLVNVGEFLLYSASWTDTADVPADAWSNSSNMPNQAASGPIDFATINNLRSSGSVYLQQIPFGRLHPGFDVVVTFESEISSAGSIDGGLFSLGGERLTRTFSYRDWADTSSLQTISDYWPFDHDPPGARPSISDGLQRNPGFLYLIAPEEGEPTGQVDRPTSTSSDSYLAFDLHDPNRDGDEPTAMLADCRINMPANTSEGGRWIIREIRIENLEYREDRLLSQSERLYSTPDASFPGGQRPSRGVAMLYRRAPSGDDELMVLSYTLEPLGRVNFDPQTERPLVLPDTFERYNQLDTGLMEQVQFQLGFSAAANRYTLTTDASDEWALQKDQLVVIGSLGSPVDAQLADRAADPNPGADAAVRIVRTQRIGMELVGFLDGAPRAGFNSMLDDLVSTETVYGWVLRDVIRSEPGGDTEVDWRVRPTGARLITLGGGS